MTQFYEMFSPPPLMVRRYSNKDFDSLSTFASESEYEDRNTLAYPDPSKSYSVLHEDIFKNLLAFVNKSIEEYVREIYQSTQKLRVTQSWLNKMQPDREHIFHYHPNSVLSGVFYLKSDGTAPLILVNERKDQYQLSLDGPGNKFTNSCYEYPSTERMLVLFPSYIRHCVARNTSSQDRISLSFNTFPIGDLGKKNSFTYAHVG
ncbi:MAG: hypothetical protein CL961_07050 [Euryarchaeota archaeon]|nr:hypothetical protein [Euryarchaeota archaeon]|tara:strand:- start:69 stop:680 length:612 start_codon:yes stop_codon:yes gene_type:complete